MTRVRKHRFSTAWGLVALALLPFGLQVWAMGSPQKKAVEDRPIAAHWGPLRGAVAREDPHPLKAGHIRLYHSHPKTNHPKIGAGVPSSVTAQARLILALYDLPAQPPLQDITAQAADLGVTPALLWQAQGWRGKRTRPEQILALNDKTLINGGTAGFILTRVARDQPQAPVDATLYCITRGKNASESVQLTYLQGIHPGQMMKIKDDLC